MFHNTMLTIENLFCNTILDAKPPPTWPCWIYFPASSSSVVSQHIDGVCGFIEIGLDDLLVATLEKATESNRSLYT